jgi:hypothetical protein
VTMLQAGNLKRVSELLPTTVRAAVGQPPICDVQKITGRAAIVRYIEFELIRMTTLISVGNNLDNEQIQFIATQLVEIFANESLADFKLCFQRGCIGQYGDIFRMDGIVLRKWMERYLEEKYRLVEEESKTEKESQHDVDEPMQGPGYLEFRAWAESLREGTKVPGMTEADYRKYGKADYRKDAASAGYKWFTVHNVQVMASTQEHANELVQKMIDRGDLIAGIT